MPVKHDLYADLNITKDELIKRRSQDAKLNQLVDDYARFDADIVKAEAGSGDVSDDQLKKLKEKRLMAKDKIVRQLTAFG
jgi:hypothetical protein